MRSTMLTLLTLGCALLAGCGNSDSGSSEAVVVNLQDVTKRLGRDVEYRKLVEARRAELDQQLADAYRASLEQIDARRKEIGGAPNEAQQTDLDELQTRIEREFRSAQTQATQELAQFQQQQASKFREEVLPIIREIAKAAGAKAVLIASEQSDLVFWHDDSIDVTDQVVERLVRESKVKPNTDGF